MMIFKQQKYDFFLEWQNNVSRVREIYKMEGAEIPSWCAVGLADKDRREITEGLPKGWLDYGVKIKKVLLFVNSLCNVLTLKWYVIAAMKA